MISLEDSILGQIKTIMRSPQGILRHPFLVPGGIFDDELWDWDSFWIAKGMFAVADCMTASLRQQFTEHAIGCWKNFFENQAANGSIPIMVKGGKRDAFGCTLSSDEERNQAKPIFGQFALDISRQIGDFKWIAPYFQGLMNFYARWTSRYRKDCGLFVWGVDVAIGSDNDPTTYGRPEFSSANLLLNCLFYCDLMASVQIAEELGRRGEADWLKENSKILKNAIQYECWDEIDGFFYSVDVQVQDHRDRYLPGIKQGMSMTWNTLPIKIKMFTGFLPLWCGIATPEQAQRLVNQHLKNPNEFQATWGVPSLAKNEKMYDPAADTANPSNWLGPIWIVANYMIYEGLKRYGYELDASTIAAKIRSLLTDDLEKTGSIHECYHPDTGKPNFNDGFLSWNVLALCMQ